MSRFFALPLVARPAILPKLPLLLSLLAAGCGYQRAKYDVNDRRILLVPFRDLSVKFGHGYGESMRGRKIIDAFRSWAEREWAPKFADAAYTDGIVAKLREWTKPRIEPKSWVNLLTGVDTDLVLLGEIIKIGPDPKAIGFQKGTAEARYSIVDARSGRDVYRSSVLKVEYPPTRDLEIPMTEFDMKKDDIEVGLLRQIGKEIGKELYGYYKDHE